ncbi:hypothetical protein GCM10022223_65660 [Kineosporia mesophila]|uniref:Uncharacterized protein n=1 Tax=Kineosporia mesophila TaxID=566012 RepID=A0ABP7AQQ8_9ACTN|nr:hypothetical protein [Kineosporia mesophila]MCD5349182.1 hypothetical protein [Kineosporia mesophila]
MVGHRISGKIEKSQAEQGFALVAVVMSIAVLSAFLLTALAYTLNAQAPSRRDQDAKAAEQAALAGVDEYISRLNANDNYWKLGSTDADNPAFSDDGQTIQGTGGAGNSTAARYQYTLLSLPGQITSTGVIRLRVTGMSGPAGRASTVKRTVLAELNRAGLLNYVYLTDYEVTDPDLAGQSSSCARYYYASGGTPARPRNTCSEIQWGGNDAVKGPLHSNDALQINGAVNFTDPQVETGWPAAATATDGKTWWGTQSPPLTNAPQYTGIIPLPESNNDLLKSVTPDVDGDGDVGPGCYYTGATRIILQGKTMKVLSPSTKRSDTPSRCYNTSISGSEQTVTIPPVIYVDSSTASCSVGAVGYPATNEKYTTGTSTAVSWGTSTNYACTRGTAYVSGTANTQVTVSGSDDVVVVGDLKPDATNGTNVVGLIAGNCVWVYHPLKTGTNSNLNSSANVTTVQAAILSLRHSFVVQNWGYGSALGTLNVYGAIAQKFRGPVGTGTATAISTGYSKNYEYDGRLTFTQPPYFLKASNSPFQILTLTDG